MKELLLALEEMARERDTTDLDEMFDTCLALGNYDIVRHHLGMLSPEIYPNYDHYLDEVEKRTRETAEVA